MLFRSCCIEGNQLFLVYEYMENNSLARALFGKLNIFIFIFYINFGKHVNVHCEWYKLRTKLMHSLLDDLWKMQVQMNTD